MDYRLHEHSLRRDKQITAQHSIVNYIQLYLGLMQVLAHVILHIFASINNPQVLPRILIQPPNCGNPR